MTARSFVPLAVVAALAGSLAVSAEAWPRPNLTASSVVDPGEVAVGSSARYTLSMCNTGGSTVYNAYMSVWPTMSYALVAQPRGGSCRAVRYSTGTYIYCMVSLRAGACGDLTLALTPPAAGDYDITGYADANNLVRETDETDNTATVTLTAR